MFHILYRYQVWRSPNAFSDIQYLNEFLMRWRGAYICWEMATSFSLFCREESRRRLTKSRQQLTHLCSHIHQPVETPRRYCRSVPGWRCGCGEVRLVKGWPWSSGGHTNTVVDLLHWKGEVSGSPLKKLGKWSIWCILGHFFAKTEEVDRFSVDKIGDEGLKNRRILTTAIKPSHHVKQWTMRGGVHASVVDSKPVGWTAVIWSLA